MHEYFLELDRTPVPQQRPRFNGTATFCYSRQAPLKRLWQAEIDHKWPYLPYNGKITLTATFIFTPPNTFFRIKRNRLLGDSDLEVMAHIKKPDLSNLLKWVEDCMEGIIFHNDSQIVQINARKRFGLKDKCAIMITTEEELVEKPNTKRLLHSS